MWNRWKTIFSNTLSWEKSYKVEHTSTMWEESAWEKAEEAFLKAFWDTPKKENISFIKNDTIFGGIKIFRNDDMVDLSLSKAIDQIK